VNWALMSSLNRRPAEGVLISDEAYEDAGATMIADVERLFAEADVTLKVKQPIFNERLDKHEVNMLRDDGILITFLHPAAPENHDIVKRLRDKNITALTMDGIRAFPVPSVWTPCLP
jgi:NAD(P) transhydrogenase subunit alpha